MLNKTNLKQLEGGIKMKRLGIIALMAILMASIVWATCSWNAPDAADTTISSTQNFALNCTPTDNVANCTLTASSSITGDSHTLLLYNDTSLSDQPTDNMSTVGNTTGAWLDSNDWSLSAVCTNASGAAMAAVALTSITLDNNDPTCTWASGLTSDTEYGPTQTWEVTGTNASYAYFHFGSNVELMTETGDNTYVFQWTGSKSTLPEGIYDVYVSVTDNTDTIDCDLLTNVEIDSEGPVKKVAAAIATDTEIKKGFGFMDNKMLWIIGGAVLLYWYTKKKK